MAFFFSADTFIFLDASHFIKIKTVNHFIVRPLLFCASVSDKKGSLLSCETETLSALIVHLNVHLNHKEKKRNKTSYQVSLNELNSLRPLLFN